MVAGLGAAGQRRDHVGGEIDLANGVIVGVGEIDRAVEHASAAGVGEARLRTHAIVVTAHPVTAGDGADAIAGRAPAAHRVLTLDDDVAAFAVGRDVLRSGQLAGSAATVAVEAPGGAGEARHGTARDVDTPQVIV